MICLVLNGNTLAENFEILEQEAEYAGLVEYRLDLLSDFGPSMVSEVERFVGQVFEKTGLRGILTIRLPVDGGKWKAGLSERTEIFRTLITNSVPKAISHIDLEIGLEAPSLVKLCKDRGIEIIRSAHDFAGTPALETFKALSEGLEPEEIFKYATTCNSVKDLSRLFAISKNFKDRRVVLLGMGEFGSPSRILYKKFGSLWTYASIKPPSTKTLAAPGQLDPKTLATLYRSQSISESTKLFGIFGDPIAHSKSPHFHNSRFIKDKKDAVYIPFRVDDLDAAKPLVEGLGIKGLSVTIPHKEGIVRWAKDLVGGVEKIGASNTLIYRAESWLATNTDTRGFYEPLSEAIATLPAFNSLSTKRALVVGAGGAARACVYELVQNGFELVIANRTKSRAQELAALMGNAVGVGLSFDEIKAAQTGDFCLIVNTSSMGMDHGSGQDATIDLPFEGCLLAYDIVYTPPITPFLKAAKEKNIAILNGELMFQKQAEAQYELFCSVMD